MGEAIRVGVVGLGSLGSSVLRALLGRDDCMAVAAVDIDPTLAGRDAGEAAGTERTGMQIRSDLAGALAGSRPDVVVIATASRLSAVAPDILTALEAGSAVVSSCEELVWPWGSSPELAAEIHAAGIEAGRPVLGLGVNPGFVQDLLVLVATGASRDVRGIYGRRSVDLSTRRQRLLAKLGVGLGPADFAVESRKGRLGHVGLAESVHLIAAGLGWQLDEVSTTEEPLVAEEDLIVGSVVVGRGLVRGMAMSATGREGGAERIRLDLEMAVGIAPEDRIEIEGDPPVRMLIEGGLSGDAATVARIVNAIPQLSSVKAGLATVLDLPPAGHTPELPVRT